MESIAAFMDRCKESKIGGIEIVITDDKRESIIGDGEYGYQRKEL